MADPWPALALLSASAFLGASVVTRCGSSAALLLRLSPLTPSLPMTPHSAPAAEPRLDLTAATLAGFFFAMLPLAVVVISICIAELGAR